MEGNMKHNTLTLRCAAKLNLSLDVTGKRPDGYHTLESIFQSISVYDTISLSVREETGITLTCDAPGVPCDAHNLAYKAAAALLKASGQDVGIIIDLHKEIPSGAGMGGGSADAAGVLYGLNLLLGCAFSNEQLREIGVRLGADVPFILLGGTAYAEGVGELLTPLRPLPELPVVVVKGTQSISTPAAYQKIDTLVCPSHPDTAAVRKAIDTQDIALLCRSCGNLFEAAVECEDVTRAKARLLACGAQCAVMTGSGAAVFGIFPDEQTAQDRAAQLQTEFAFARAAVLTSASFLTVPEVTDETI